MKIAEKIKPSYKKNVLLGCAFTALMSASNAFAADMPNDNGEAIATNDQKPVLMAQLASDNEESVAVEVETDRADETAIDEITVIGSRLRKTVFSSDLPIEVITTEVGELAGVGSTQELIRRSTLLTGSQQSDNQQSVSFIGGRSVNGGNGTNTLSLRGLGSERTLILLDGKRLTPSGIGGGVSSPNISILPSTVISQVEILKDGASSIYGSDAIAGIVDSRLIGATDKDMLTGHFNLTEDGGAEFFQVAGRWSKTFDKGHFNVAGQIDTLKALKLGDRDFTACRDPRLTDPATGQRVDIRDANGDIVCTSFGSNNRFFLFRGGAGNFFDPDSLNARFSGLYIPDPNGTIIGPGQDELRSILPEFARVGITNLGRGSANDPFFGPEGGDFEQVAASNALLPQTSDIIQNSNAQNPENRYSVFVSGAYELSNSVEAYGHVLASRVETDVSSFRFLYEYLGGNHPSNTVAERIRAATDGGLFGALGFNMHRPYVEDTKTDYVYGIGGLRGTFGNSLPLIDGWDWDIYAQYGRSDADYTRNFTRQDRLDAVTGFTDIGCDTSLINSDLLSAGQSAQGLCDSIGGAIPWLSPRILRDGDFNAAELAFLEGTETGNTLYDQVVLEGFMTGEVPSVLPAGDISVALGFHLQHDRIIDQPGANSLAANNHNFSNSNPTNGHSGLREVFGEVGIPLVEGKPGFERLSLTASGRLTDNTRIDDGAAFTYKLGAAWEPVTQLKLRAGYGTSYRSPALFELFRGGAESFGFFDPCTNLQNSGFSERETENLIQNCGLLGVGTDFQPTLQTRILNQGNNTGTLKSETSQALNLGIVIQPDFANLAFAVDYYDIDVQDQIGSLGAGAIGFRCLVQQSFNTRAELDANQFCALLAERDAEGNLPFVINGSLNIAEQRSRGIDYSLRYNNDFGAYNFNFNGQVTQVLEDFINRDRDVDDPVNDDIDRTLLPFRPEFTGNFEFSLSRGPFTGFWNVRYIGASDRIEFDRRDPNSIFNDDGTYQDFGSYRFLNPLLTDRKVEEYFEHTVSFRYDLDDSLRFNAGVQNLFDQKPPQVGNFIERVGTSASGPYDFRGRRFFFRATKTF